MGVPEAGLPEVSPPEDAENWSDEEWISWLDSTDDDGASQPYVPTAPKKRSIGSQMLGAAMLGLHEMMYGRREDRQVQIATAPGPPDDEDMTITLDPDDPSKSEVRFRDGG